MHAITGYHNYYSLILIPAGMAFYIMIRFGSDLSASNRRLIMHSDPHNGKIMGSQELLESVARSQIILDNMHAIKGLPMRIGEIGIDHSVTLREPSYLYHTIGRDNITAYDNMLCISRHGSYACMFVARIAYDMMMDGGAFSLVKATSIKAFLAKNHIIAPDRITDCLLDAAGNEKSTMVNLGRNSSLLMRRIACIYSKGNAVLLFLLINNFIEVIDC